jgi:cell division protein FtsX
MKLLVPQDSAFSVRVLGVFRLHGLVLGLLGVMFTSLLDLYQASRSCHKVLDELYPEVFLSMLNSCINIKLQNRHAQMNLLYQGG